VTSKKSSRPTQYQAVDQEFYSTVAKQNGGKLPPDLLGKNGKPRKLTMGAKDAAYRKEWLTIAAKTTKSKAVNKPVGSSGTCNNPKNPEKGKNGGGAGTAAQPAVAAGAAAKQLTSTQQKQGQQKTKPVPCKHGGLQVKCEHKDRGFVLDSTLVNTGPPTIDVLGNHGDVMTCSTKIVAGPCGNCRGKVFDLNPEDSENPGEHKELTTIFSTKTTKTDSQLKFQAIPYSLGISKLAALRYLWPQTIEPRSYTVSVHTCEGADQVATVRVFPEISWSASFSWEMASEQEWKGESASGDKVDGIVTNTQSDFKIKFSANINSTTSNYGAEITDLFKPVFSAGEELASFTSGLRDCLTAVGGLHLGIDYPKVVVGYDWGWQEIKGQPICGWAGTLSLKLDPLIGIHGTVEVGEFIINKYPGVGQLIETFREKCKDFFDVRITLYGGVAIAGAISADKNLMIDGHFQFKEASIEGDGKVILEGIAVGHLHVWYLQASAGAKVGAISKVSAKLDFESEEAGLFASGKLAFDGIKLYASYFYSMGITSKAGKDPDDIAGADAAAESASPEGDPENKSKGTSQHWDYELVGPHEKQLFRACLVSNKSGGGGGGSE
jgi:hypothetical protein